MKNRKRSGQAAEHVVLGRVLLAELAALPDFAMRFHLRCTQGGRHDVSDVMRRYWEAANGRSLQP